MPFLLAVSFKQTYKNSIKKRCFFQTFFQESAALYWFHACSYGEIKSLQNILLSLQEQLTNDEKILITTTTQTGYNLAKTSFPNAIICFLPFESFIPFWIKSLKLKNFTLTEAELWLMPLVCAKKKGATTLLINARISSNSYPTYLKFAFFYKRLFSLIDKFFCQRKIDNKHLKT